MLPAPEILSQGKASQTVPPSGNTQTQVLMMGSRGTRNGQPVTSPVKLTPGGAIVIERALLGQTGVYIFRSGGAWNLDRGIWKVGAPEQRMGGVNTFDPGGFGVGGA